jgi:flagellar basal body-associated protein FliL
METPIESPVNNSGLENQPKSKEKMIIAVIIIVLILIILAVGLAIVKNKQNSITPQPANNGPKTIKVNFTAPAGFPADFPTPPNSVNMDNSSLTNGNDTQLNRLFENKESVAKISAFYESYFSDKTHGWTLASSQPKNTNPKSKTIFVMNKGGVMMINISPMGSSSMIDLSFIKTISK